MNSRGVSGAPPGDAQQYAQRLGLVMCGLYALAYTVFVVIAVFDVTLMDTRMPFGLNLATFYGFGLIVFALFLAFVYSVLCSRRESSSGRACSGSGSGEQHGEAP